MAGVVGQGAVHHRADGCGKKRLCALAEWDFGGGGEYCGACGETCGDCPSVLNAPQTVEGVQVWDLVGRLLGQMRVTTGAVTGIDMGAAFAMADALGINPLIVAEWLPAVETRLVKAMNDRREN